MSFLRRSWSEIKAIVFASLVGIVVMAVFCLIFAGVILSSGAPVEWIVIFAAVSCFAGGFDASLIMGHKGKIMLFSLALLICIELILFIIGMILFDGMFVPTEDPFLIVALFLGLISGGVIANTR